MKKLITFLLCALALSPALAINDPQELLEPDQAFALSVRVRDAETLEASWKIAKGYYMYRDKFQFVSLIRHLHSSQRLSRPARKRTTPPLA